MSSLWDRHTFTQCGTGLVGSVPSHKVSEFERKNVESKCLKLFPTHLIIVFNGSKSIVVYYLFYLDLISALHNFTVVPHYHPGLELTPCVNTSSTNCV